MRFLTMGIPRSKLLRVSNYRRKVTDKTDKTHGLSVLSVRPRPRFETFRAVPRNGALKNVGVTPC